MFLHAPKSIFNNLKIIFSTLIAFDAADSSVMPGFLTRVKEPFSECVSLCNCEIAPFLKPGKAILILREGKIETG